MSPEEWKVLLRHPSPDDFLNDADESTRNAVRTWQQRRKSLITERMRMELEARFEDNGLDQKPSRPFIKFLIQDATVDERLTETSGQAFLTIWGPSPDQLELFQENASIRGQQLSVRKFRYDGLLQLSGNARTQFSATLTGPSSALTKMAASPPLSRGVFQTTLLSKRCVGLAKGPLIDLVGIMLHSKRLGDLAQWHTYVSDRSGMLLRIDSPSVLPECGTRPFIPTLFRSVRVLPFDDSENMAVVVFGNESSCCCDEGIPQLRRISRWSRTNGRSRLEQSVTVFKAKLPALPKIRSPFSTFLAYVTEVLVLSSHHFIVKVDHGGADLLFLNLPLLLLPKIRTDENGAKLDLEEEMKLSKLSALHRLYRSRLLHLITVRELDKSVQGCEGCRHEAVDFRVADTAALSSWYVRLVDRTSRTTSANDYPS